MPRRKIEDNHIRSLTKVSKGRSYAVILPVEMVREFGWKERQRLVVKRIKGGLVIKDYKSK